MKQLLKTKHAGKKLAAVLIAFTLFLPSLTAQVTIGADLEPNDGSLLQLKEKEEVTKDFNSSKGLNLPRVRLSVKTSLYPMFLEKPANSASDPNDPALGPNDKYRSDSLTLKASHTGLMVYNLTTTNNFNEGIYTWDGEKWVYSDGIEPWYNVKTQAPAINNTDEVYLDATVTIGKAIDEEERVYAHGALLQLVEEYGEEEPPSRRSVEGPHNAYHGLAMPRVKLTHKNELYPMFLPKPEYHVNATDNTPKEHGYDDPTTKADLKASHKGLMVYNVSINNGFSPGIYTWDGTQWEKTISDASMPNLLKSIDIPIGVDITTQTIAFYGQVGYVPEGATVVDEDAPEDAYYIMTLEPIMVSGDIDFTPNNLFFSTSVRPAKIDTNSNDIESGNSYWKIKIENRNIDSGDTNKHAEMRSVRIYYYTPRGGKLKAILDTDGVTTVTAIQFEGLDSDPNQ
ncbi:hypothetical protein [Dysgonomonas gadei]|uniref:hypothetical protein n=1 Tax=Dysgonomonas gadei TaxID=156974 RepID=UPI003AF06503